MKSVDFCYWLQGLFEIGDPKELNAEQVEIIKRHLNMVFYHEIDKMYPPEDQKILNEIHSPEMKQKLGVTENGTPIHPNNFRPRC
jgi:hypothetical protein